MKKTILFLSLFFIPLCVSMAKNIYTYTLVKPNNEPVEQYVFPNTPNFYGYKIQLSPNPSGFGKGVFEVTLENGKFADGSTILTNIYENQIFNITWDDIANQGNIYGIVKISKGSAANTSTDTIKAGSPIQFSHQIASIKGQIPSLSAGPNRLINDNSQIIASVTDMVYPGINEYNNGIYTNKKVRKFEWTLPTNWVTTTGKSGTFVTDLDVKQITIIPDFVNTGSIKVRGVNDVGTAYSEYATQNFDRGFFLLSFPQTINFGDFTPLQFSTTSEPGITFEWNAPDGWKINGQTNSITGVNLNSVSVTPSFCSMTKPIVKVRLIKGSDISDWYTFSGFQGFSAPYISQNSSVIYQYENADFSINNIVSNGINHIEWSGTGVVTNFNQGTSSKIAFANSNMVVLIANIYMNNCNSPISLNMNVNVLPSRLTYNAPANFCTNATYSVDHLPSLGNTVTWNVVNPSIVTYPTSGNPITISKLSNGKISVQPIINNCTPFPPKEISVGFPYSIGILNYSNLTMWDAGNFQILPSSGYYQYEGVLSVADVAEIATSYTWSLISNTSGKPVYWWPNGGSVDVACKFSNSSLTLKCTASNSCGSYYQYYTFSTSSIVPLLLSPNPASSQVSIDMSNTTTDPNTSTALATPDITTTTSYNVSVLDSYGMTIYSGMKKEKKFLLQTGSFRNGIYTVLVSDGQNLYQSKLSVQH